MPACIKCGVWAGDEAWRTYCRVCYITSPKAKSGYTKLVKDLEFYKNRCAELEARQTFSTAGRYQLDKTLVQRLIVLCHPDKHANSELSTKVTQFLLNLRERL